MSTTINNPALPTCSAELPLEISLRSNVLWTLLGQITFGMCQWLMLIAIARLGLPEMVGQFALAMAITSPIILCLDLRTVQVTDQSQRFSFDDLFCLRIVTLAVAMISIAGIAAWGGYNRETATLIVVMGIAKCIESVSDLCHGTLQQHEHLVQMAKARIARGMMSVIVLAAGLYVFHSIMLATALLAVLWIGILIFSDWPMAFHALSRKGLSRRLWRFRPKESWHLLVAAIPTGILSCQTSLEQNLPRLFVDSYMGERELGIFSAVSSLIIVATTIINSVHSAVLPRIAKFIVNHEWGLAQRKLVQLSLIGIFVGGLGTLVVYVGGGWFLAFVFGDEYASQSQLLVVLMLAATLRYATAPLSTALRAAQRFWPLAIRQSFAMIAAIPAMMFLVHRYHAMGAAYSMVVMAVLFALMQIPVFFWLLKLPDALRLANAGTFATAQSNSPDNQVCVESEAGLHRSSGVPSLAMAEPASVPDVPKRG